MKELRVSWGTGGGEANCNGWLWWKSTFCCGLEISVEVVVVVVKVWMVWLEFAGEVAIAGLGGGLGGTVL